MAFLPEYTLFDEFELRGTWWNPANPDHKVAGRLYWTPHEGGRLELATPLAEPRGNPWETIVHGDVAAKHATSLKVTLENVFCRRDPSHRNTQVCTGTRLYCGAHLDPTDPGLIRSTHLHLESLFSWYGFEPWAMEGGQPLRRTGEREHTLIDRDPRSTVCRIEGIGGNLQFSSSKRSDYSHSSLSIDHDIAMASYFSPRPFREWHDYVHAQFRLITLLSCCRAYPKRIELELRRGVNDQRLLGDGVAVYLRHSWRRDDWPSIGMEMPFQFPRLGPERLAAVAEKWFELQGRLGDCMRLLFRQIERPGDEIVPRFLSACQMFEAFHRETLGGLYVEQDQYEGWRQAVVAAIPSDIPRNLRDALKARLKYGNQLSLRTRLRQTFAALPSEIQRVLELDPKRDADAITATRNYHTHLDPSSANSIVEEGELPPVSSKLVMTVGYLLWCELGLADLVRPGDVNHLWILS